MKALNPPPTLTEEFTFHWRNWLSFLYNFLQVEDWNSVTFEVNWSQHSNTNFNTVGYYLDPFGRVHLRGLATHSTGGAGTNIFRLPTGYRPSKNEVMVVRCNASATPCEVWVLSDGYVYLDVGIATVWASLDGISFRI